MPQSEKPRTAANRRLPRPFLQGDLDGLCGLYSVTNAVRVLCPELDDDAVWYLFDALIRRLVKAGAEPAVFLTSGIGCNAVVMLLKAAAAHIAGEYDIRLRARRLPDDLRHARELTAVWAWLVDHIGPSSAAIMCLSGRLSHWTVAAEATGQQLRLFDSVRMGVLRRRECTIGRSANRYSITPAQVFLIERLGPKRRVKPEPGLAKQ